MVIVLEHLNIHVNVILGGLDLIVQLIVGAIIIPHVVNGLEYVTSVKIGRLDSFVNIASKLDKLKIFILTRIQFVIFNIELEVTVTPLRLKGVINAIVTVTVMSNLVFVILLQENVIVNTLLKETIASFVKKHFSETQSIINFILLCYEMKTIQLFS